MMNINTDLLKWCTNFLIKSRQLVVLLKDQELAEELHKPIIRKFEKRKVH